MAYWLSVVRTQREPTTALASNLSQLRYSSDKNSDKQRRCEELKRDNAQNFYEELQRFTEGFKTGSY